MFKKLKQLLSSKPESKIVLKTLKELDYLDSVWIKDKSDNILEGWVFDINKKHIIVTIPLYNNQFIDFKFNVTRPLSQTQLTQNNVTIYLNKPCE